MVIGSRGNRVDLNVKGSSEYNYTAPRVCEIIESFPHVIWVGTLASKNREAENCSQSPWILHRRVTN